MEARIAGVSVSVDLINLRFRAELRDVPRCLVSASDSAPPSPSARSTSTLRSRPYDFQVSAYRRAAILD